MMNSNAFQAESDTQLQSQFPATSNMTVMEFLCGTWKEFYRSDRTIIQILQSAGIHHQSFVKVHKTASINDDRYAVIIDTVNRKTKFKDRIIIDVIKGEPTWEQMMDITYGIGSECNTRIIIYNVGDDRSYCLDWDISNFVLMSNEHGLSTYVLSANVENDRIDHEVIERDQVGAEPTRNQFPSKYEMQRTKFDGRYCQAQISFQKQAAVPGQLHHIAVSVAVSLGQVQTHQRGSEAAPALGP